MNTRSLIALGLTLAGSALADADQISKVAGDDRTGTVRITYASGKILDAPQAKDQQRLSSPGLAGDHKTVGWLANFDNCCQSYPIPLALVLFRSGKVLHTFVEGMMIWSWAFTLDGRNVVVALGPTHGVEHPVQYKEYSVDLGALVATWDEDPAEPCPDWARSLRATFFSGRALPH